MEYILQMEKGRYKEYPLASFQNKNEIPKERFTYFELEGIRYFYVGEECHYYEREATISIEERGDLCISNFLSRCVLHQDELIVDGFTEGLYQNGKAIHQIVTKIETGDILFLSCVKIVIHKDWLEIYGEKGNGYDTSLLEGEKEDFRFVGFPYFNRAPRIIKVINEDEIRIESPPTEKSMGAKSILFTFVPTLATMLVTVGVGLMIGRGMMLLMSVGISGVMMVVNTVKFLSERKESKRYNKKREQVYRDYLMRMRKIIYQRYTQNKEALAYQQPSLERIDKMIHEYSSRLYERKANEDDFMHLNIGYQNADALFCIHVDDKEVEMEKDPLLEEAQQIRIEYDKKMQKPYIVDLKEVHLGVVGSAETIWEQLNNYMMQLTFLHSYHDLEIIFIHNEKRKEQYAHLRWYPHCHIHASNVRSIVYTETMRDQLLGMLYQIIRERKNKQEESKKETRFRPHFLFVIEDADMVLNHSIMEFLSMPHTSLDFSMIYTTNKAANLPENVTTVVLLEDYENARVLVDKGIYQNITLRLERPNQLPLEEEARKLASVVHEEIKKSQLPESIRFLQLYQVEKVTELQAKERWKKNHAYQNMAVPLGVKGKEDIVYLDLHEKAHGPHGLVAGTTGSGKSEIVQSYLLSLAICFHPDEVGFLLIDYKGGGMANLFKDLPHLLGTITNLDGSETLRAMASIKSELKRRQRIFNHHNVNNINDYHKLYLNQEAEEPLPHLMLVSDEFAELKKEQPEFMKELVSTARIGRSLGVHLILATQKPSGVVDEQIWSNSKFKLCLKVQSESDSKEMLKSTDAASITQAGRAYLQVGNNEIYELFQSAWSGAVYQEESKEEQIDERIYLINELGQGKVINENLSEKENRAVMATELDVCVAYLKQEYESETQKEIKKPWLLPLPSQIVTPKAEVNETLHMKTALGLVDIPNEQRQETYVHDFEREGHLAYFAMSGYGKSMFLQSLVMDLAGKNHIDHLQMVILDFGSGALQPLSALPHTMDYIKTNDEEKLHKFTLQMEEMMQQRKEAFAAKEVSSLRMYNQMQEEKEKAILIVVDQFDIVKEMGMEMERFFAKLAREGAGLGMYLAFSVAQSSAVKYTIMGSVRKRIVGMMSDNGEVNTLLGRSEWKINETKGRVLVKLDQVYPMQVYVPVSFENEMDYLMKLKEEIKTIQKREGVKAEQIKVLPKELYYSDLSQYPKGKGDFMLGLSYNEVEQVGMEYGNTPFVIAGGNQCGKTNAISLLLHQIAGQHQVYIVDTKFMEHYHFQDSEFVHYMRNDDIAPLINDMKILIKERKQQLEAFIASHPESNSKQFYNEIEKIFIVIDNYQDIESQINKNLEYGSIISEAMDMGVNVIASVNVNTVRGNDAFGKRLKIASSALVLSSMGVSGFLPNIKKINISGIGKGNLMKNGEQEQIMIAHRQEKGLK